VKLLLVNITQLCSAILSVLFAATPIAALTININDLTARPVVTSDGTNTRIEIVTELGLERVRIFDPAFNNLPLGKEVFLIEPGAVSDDHGLTLVSDEICLCAPGLDGPNGLLFESDPAEPTIGERRVNCSIIGFICIPETGGPQNVADLLFGPNSGIVINITSDVSEGHEVPEPSTFFLVGIGLIALLAHDRLRKQKQPVTFGLNQMRGEHCSGNRCIPWCTLEHSVEDAAAID